MTNWLRRRQKIRSDDLRERDNFILTLKVVETKTTFSAPCYFFFYYKTVSKSFEQVFPTSIVFSVCVIILVYTLETSVHFVCDSVVYQKVTLKLKRLLV
jgi:hypothetical protein